MSSLPDLRAYLRTLDVRTLAELLSEQAERDPQLRHELELRASAQGGAVAEAHRMLDDAAPEVTTHEEGLDYATKVGPVLDTLRRMLDAGTQADLTPLARRTVDKIGEAAGRLDDPTGAVGAELRRAVALYARACAAHPPQPESLADWILRTQFDRPGWPQINLADFAQALGERGIRHVKSTVDEVLAERNGAADSRRATAERLREQVAEVSGDVDTLVAILSAKPPRLEISLRIVRALRAAGRHAEAIAHAAKARVHDKGARWGSVVEALADTGRATRQETTHHAARETARDSEKEVVREEARDTEQDSEAESERGAESIVEPDAVPDVDPASEALSLRRTEFERNPVLGEYLALRETAIDLGRWETERERALEFLRQRAEERSDRDSDSAASDSVDGYTADGDSADGTDFGSAGGGSAADELIRALLAEEWTEEAWEAAERHGGSLDLMLEMARLREIEHPGDVIPVYRRHVEELIARKDATHYRHAARQLRKLRTLYRRAGNTGEFAEYLAELVETHKRKTRLITEIRNARIALPKIAQ